MGVRRSPEELSAWKGRDPLRRLTDSLSSERAIPAAQIEQIGKNVRDMIGKAVEAARVAPYPEQAALLDLVYASRETRA